MTVNYTTLQVERLDRLIAEAVAAERERCAKVADGFVERTNADIAHAIAAAIRNTD